jgi:hypothetical protein
VPYLAAAAAYIAGLSLGLLIAQRIGSQIPFTPVAVRVARTSVVNNGPASPFGKQIQLFSRARRSSMCKEMQPFATF